MQQLDSDRFGSAQDRQKTDEVSKNIQQPLVQFRDLCEDVSRCNLLSDSANGFALSSTTPSCTAQPFSCCKLGCPSVHRRYISATHHTATETQKDTSSFTRCGPLQLPAASAAKPGTLGTGAASAAKATHRQP